MDPFLLAVQHTLAQSRMIAQAQRSLVAVSGGPDSVALLAALFDLGHDLAAAHFNHGWRGAESDRDEGFVRRLCHELGIRLIVGHAGSDRARGDGGAEQVARVARYRFLAAAAGQMGCARIATGHTRDDQAETVLMRLMRGAHAAGLAGIQRARADGVVRPLLDVDRADVVAYLARRGLGFVEDSSNRDPRFTRNRLRLEVLPKLVRASPAVVARLACLADAMAARSSREEALAAELLRHVGDGQGGLVLLRLPAEPSARALVVRAWLRRQRGDLRRLGAAHVKGVAACVRSGATVALPRGENVFNDHGVLRLRGRSAAEAPATASVRLDAGAVVRFGGYEIEASAAEPTTAGVDLPLGLWQAVLDSERAPLPLAVRTWQAGDRIQPLGMAGHRKLSDVFIDAKVPRWRRHVLPVLECGGVVLWVPGVVRAAAAAVDASSRQLVRLAARPLAP